MLASETDPKSLDKKLQNNTEGLCIGEIEDGNGVSLLILAAYKNHFQTFETICKHLGKDLKKFLDRADGNLTTPFLIAI